METQERRASVIAGHLVSFVPSSSSSGNLMSKEVNEESTEEKSILLESVSNGIQIITLNRPDHLNAINESIVFSMQDWLSVWKADGNVKAVITGAKGNRAFSAGGDLRHFSDVSTVRKNNDLAAIFLGEEFFLVSQVWNFPKPFVTIWNGITMGGGAGITFGSTFKIGTENLLFAMPEVGIGFVVDVGAVYFLPRLKGPKGIGLYIGLTSARLGPADALFTNVITHYVPEGSLESLMKDLKELPNPTREAIEMTIAKYSTNPGSSSLSAVGPLITYCFGSPKSMEDIISKLELLASGKEEVPSIPKEESQAWAKDITKNIRRKAPLSLKIVFKMLTQYQHLDINAAVNLEFRICSRLLARSNNFYEGVRALLIDRDNRPKWQPPTLAEVTDEYVDSFFLAFSQEEEHFKFAKLLELNNSS